MAYNNANLPPTSAEIGAISEAEFQIRQSERWEWKIEITSKFRLRELHAFQHLIHVP